MAQQQQENPSLSTTSASTTAATASLFSKKPPIYITIGPPCAGKTTLLKKLDNKILDVTLDHQRDVYVKVPTRLLLLQQNNNDSLSMEDTRILQHRVQYKTMESRILDNKDNAELRAILQRLNNQLSAEEFRHTITTLYQNYSTLQEQNKRHNNNTNTTTLERQQGQDEVFTREDLILPETNASSTVVQQTTTNDDDESIDMYQNCGNTLIEAIEDILQNSNSTSVPIALPNTTDVFCVESLFRPHSSTNQTGVEAASLELHRLAANTNHAVAWGNTNTRPSDYKIAMEVAQRTGRPVQFVVYMDSRIVEEDNSCVLPKLPLEELLRRSLRRLLETGKYVPAKSILESSQRVSNLVALAMRELERTYRGAVDKRVDNKDDDPATVESPAGNDADTKITPERTFTKLQLDTVLAKLINFDMQPDRTVRYVPPPRRKKDIHQRGSRNGGRGWQQQQHNDGQRNDYRPSDVGRHKNNNNNTYGRPRRDSMPGPSSSPPKRWKEDGWNASSRPFGPSGRWEGRSRDDSGPNGNSRPEQSGRYAGHSQEGGPNEYSTPPQSSGRFLTGQRSAPGRWRDDSGRAGPPPPPPRASYYNNARYTQPEPGRSENIDGSRK